MSVAIEKIEGVESVTVSLNEGTADIKLKPGNKVTVEQLREVVRRNGFTPKASAVRVAGKLIERNGKPALEVTGLELVLLLAGDQLSVVASKAGKTAVIAGTVSEDEKRNAPQTLLVSGIEPP